MKAKDLYKYLLFDSVENLIEYGRKNGIEMKVRKSKSTQEEIFFADSGSLAAEPCKDMAFMHGFIHAKRDKRYFLTEPEELVDDRFMTRSFFAFGDFKESVSKQYMMALVKALKDTE